MSIHLFYLLVVVTTRVAGQKVIGFIDCPFWFLHYSFLRLGISPWYFLQTTCLPKFEYEEVLKRSLRDPAERMSGISCLGSVCRSRRQQGQERNLRETIICTCEWNEWNLWFKYANGSPSLSFFHLRWWEELSWKKQRIDHQRNRRTYSHTHLKVYICMQCIGFCDAMGGKMSEWMSN
jgi:hypothetical protein